MIIVLQFLQVHILYNQLLIIQDFFCFVIMHKQLKNKPINHLLQNRCSFFESKLPIFCWLSSLSVINRQAILRIQNKEFVNLIRFMYQKRARHGSNLFRISCISQGKKLLTINSKQLNSEKMGGKQKAEEKFLGNFLIASSQNLFDLLFLQNHFVQNIEDLKAEFSQITQNYSDYLDLLVNQKNQLLVPLYPNKHYLPLSLWITLQFISCLDQKYNKISNQNISYYNQKISKHMNINLINQILKEDNLANVDYQQILQRQKQNIGINFQNLPNICQYNRKDKQEILQNLQKLKLEEVEQFLNGMTIKQSCQSKVCIKMITYLKLKEKVNLKQKQMQQQQKKKKEIQKYNQLVEDLMLLEKGKKQKTIIKNIESPGVKSTKSSKKTNKKALKEHKKNIISDFNNKMIKSQSNLPHTEKKKAKYVEKIFSDSNSESKENQQEKQKSIISFEKQLDQLLSEQILEVAQQISEKANKNQILRTIVFNRLMQWFSYYGVAIELFGSFSMGLALQNSDIDLLIYPANAIYFQNKQYLKNFKCQCLEEIQTMLYMSNICYDMKLIKTATVPVLKLDIKPFSFAEEECIIRCKGYSIPQLKNKIIKVDMIIGQKYIIGNKIYNNNTTEVLRCYLDKYVCFKPLFLILKNLLNEKQLNLAFKGGMSSYCLGLIIIAYLEEMDQNGQPLQNINEVFYGFLDFICNFNIEEKGIDLRMENKNRPFYYLDKQAFEYIDKIKVKDPLSDTLINQNCSTYKKIINLFKKILETRRLTEKQLKKSRQQKKEINHPNYLLKCLNEIFNE